MSPAEATVVSAFSQNLFSPVVELCHLESLKVSHAALIAVLNGVTQNDQVANAPGVLQKHSIAERGTLTTWWGDSDE